MSKNFYINLIAIITILLLLAGCSSKQNTGNTYSNTVIEAQLPASTSIQKLTEDSINKRYEEADDICFNDYKSIDNVSYLAFTFKYKQSLYYGFSVAEKADDLWKLSYIEDYPIDQNESVMITQFIGNYLNSENRKFHITLGHINDEQIKQVILYYPTSQVNIIKLGDNQQEFIDINSNSNDSLLKIECKSNDEKILYKKELDKN